LGEKDIRVVEPREMIDLVFGVVVLQHVGINMVMNIETYTIVKGLLHQRGEMSWGEVSWIECLNMIPPEVIETVLQ
jgi:hypothetical protein